MRTRVIAGIGVLALALTAGLTACSGSSGDAGGKVELTVWTGFTGGDRPGYAKIVSDFNASHPNIHVKMSVQPWDTIAQKLPSAWLTGQGPDLATPSPDPNAIAQYVKTRSLLPITKTGGGKDQIDVDALAPGTVKEFTYDGKLYAIPANFATLSLYYNKKMFAAAGIEKTPTTVAEFQDAAKKLTIDKGQTQSGLVLADNQTIQMWPVLQWISGGDIVDGKNCSVVQTDAGRKSLEPWAKLVAEDGVSPVGLTGAEADSVFSAGKAAMEINGPWAAPGYKDAGIDLGIAPVPGGATLGATAGLAVSAKTKHPTESQEFLAYWTSKSVQKAFSLKTGFPPLRTDLADDSELKNDPVISVFAAQVPDARLYLPKVPNATKVDTDAYGTLIGQITRGTSVDEATTTAGKTIDQLTGCGS